MLTFGQKIAREKFLRRMFVYLALLQTKLSQKMQRDGESDLVLVFLERPRKAMLMCKSPALHCIMQTLMHICMVSRDGRFPSPRLSI